METFNELPNLRFTRQKWAWQVGGARKTNYTLEVLTEKSCSCDHRKAISWHYWVKIRKIYLFLFILLFIVIMFVKIGHFCGGMSAY